MSDYYSYAPLVKLERPVLLTGFPGSRPLLTGRVASMITGVPLVMLPRQVAHRVSKTPEGLLRNGDRDVLARAERVILEAALDKPRLVALGPTTLEDPDNRAWLRSRAQIVYLYQPLEAAIPVIEAEMQRDVRKHRHLDAHAPLGPQTLRPLFTRRDALFRELAEVTVEIAGRPPLGVGRALPEVLGWEAIERD